LDQNHQKILFVQSQVRYLAILSPLKQAKPMKEKLFKSGLEQETQRAPSRGRLYLQTSYQKQTMF